MPFSRFFVQCASAECEHQLYAQVVDREDKSNGDDDGEDEDFSDDHGGEDKHASTPGTSARTPLIPSKQPLYARFIEGFRRVALFGQFGQDGVLGDPPPVHTFEDFLTETESLWRPLAVPNGRYFDGRAFVNVSATTQHRDDAAAYGETLALHGSRAGRYEEVVPRGPIGPPVGLLLPIYTICSTWKQVFIDSNWPVFGDTEDFFLNVTLGEAPARYTSAVVVDSNKQVVWAGTLDSGGCTDPIQLPTGAYWLFQDTQLDDGTRKFNILSGLPQMNGGNGTWNGVHVSQFTTAGAGGLVTLHPNDHSSFTRLAAVMGQVLVTPDNGLKAGGFVYNVFAEQGCFATQNKYCTDFTTQTCFQACYDRPSKTLLVGPNEGDAPPDSAYKFIITHELGHYVQDVSFGDQFWTYAVDQNGDPLPQLGVQTPECRCDHVSSANRLHCLQSDEGQGFGSHEGFAHFYSSRIWNDPSFFVGVFTYYKHFLQPFPNLPSVNTAPPVPRVSSGVIKWLDNRCAMDPNKAGRAVEWDWLTFYYEINTGSVADRTPLGGATPNLGSIYERACGTPGTPCNSQSVLYANLVGAAATEYGQFDARFVRLSATGNSHGINH